MLYTRGGQLAARGPHVACQSIFSGPQKHLKHSRKLFKPDIFWKMYMVTFVSLNCMCWIKCICNRTI